MIWIYDIETFINFFCVTFKNPKSQEIKQFIIFEDVNQGEELLKFIQSNSSSWFIGYNSEKFDNQLLNYLYKNSFETCMSPSSEITRNVWNLSGIIIRDKIIDYKYNLPFRQIDLMKIGRYKKSLKLLGVNLKWSKLQDLPLPYEAWITKEQVPTILDYNLNDVLITEQLYYHLKNAIKFRHELSEIYEIDLYNESDTGIADRLLEKFYSESTGIKIQDFKNLRTERKFIKFDWVVFKDIYFDTPEFIGLLELIKNHTYYKDQPFFSKKITFDNIIYKLGLGGLHTVDEPGLFEETKDNYIIDADIGSMYPATLLNNDLSPEHLGTKFLKQFRKIRDDRLIEKALKNKTKSEGLKLIMNVAIGKTRNKYSFLFDALVNLQVTVNGQLYILMLIEKLVLNGFKIISANTDGITTIVPKDKVDLYYSICKEWEKQHHYELEYVKYKKYVRRDVNNYLAIKEDDIKEKGIFNKTWPKFFNNSTDPLSKGWDKPIVSKALYDFFVNNIPIIQTINNSTDIHDFCIAKRIDDKFTNVFHTMKNGKYQKEDLQRSVRYYVSKDGGVLLKTCEGEDKTSNYEVNKRVTIFNNYIHYDDFSKYNIDYNYYINHTQKIIDLIINPQLTLF
jgi:hypothetical protein